MKTRPSLLLIQIPKEVLWFWLCLGVLHDIGAIALLQGDKELNDRDDDYALIISLNSSNSLLSIEAYTPISSLNSSTLSWIYLSACDPANISVHNKIDSLGLKSKKYLSLFSDVFLSTKKKYKPVAKKVHPVIGELPDKFWIERKITGNPLESMPKLNLNPLSEDTGSSADASEYPCERLE
jgi:hypothetical protein